MDKYFKKAGDLPETPKKGKLKFSSNIEKNFNKEQNNNSIEKSAEEIQAYLDSISTGSSNYKNIQEAGSIITSLEKVYEMIENGYNIINAKYLTKDVVCVDFEKISKKGRRF